MKSNVNKDSKAVYSISSAAKILGMSVRMIREYEKDGLIKPYRNVSNGYRLYSNEDIKWILCIRDLIHQQGLNIKGIQRLLMVMPCWEIKKCSEENRVKCKATVGRKLPCWLIVGSSCKKANKCRSCEVYIEAKKSLN